MSEKNIQFLLLEDLGEVSQIVLPKIVSQDKKKHIVITKLPAPIFNYAHKENLETSIKLQKYDIIFNPKSYSSWILLTDVKEDLFLDCNFYLIRIDSRYLNPYYFFLFFQKDVIKNYESGSIVKKIYLKSLSEIIIPLPSQRFQNEIIKIIDRFELIQNNNFKLYKLIKVTKKRRYTIEFDNILKNIKLNYLISIKNKSINKVIFKEFNDLMKIVSMDIFKPAILISSSLIEFYIMDWLEDLTPIEKNIKFYIAIEKLKDLYPDIDSAFIQKCHNVRNLRNYVHMKKYVNELKSFTKEEVMEAVSVLNLKQALKNR